LYSSQGIVDLRPGSILLQVGANNTPILQLQIQRSADLNTWTSHTDDLIEVEMPMSGASQFYRFAMPKE
jgi:hypothetical protein